MAVPYTVRPGDNLTSIALRFGLKAWQDLYYSSDNAAFRAKRPNPNLVFAGDVIMVPGKSSLPAAPKVVTPPPTPTPATTVRTCDLPATSIFVSWPAPLLETLCRSYKAHASGNRYLDNAFWGGEPASFDDALTRFGGPAQHAIKWVYDRASAITGLWPFIQFIHNAWSLDSHGFTFTCTDKGKLRTFLDSSASFCRDIPIMMSDHQAAGPAQCWREIVNGTAGLHICIPKSDTGDQSTVAGESGIHIDPHQIVKGKDSDGTCSYSASGVISHGKDVGAGVARRKLEQLLKDIDEATKSSNEFWKNEPKGPKW